MLRTALKLARSVKPAKPISGRSWFCNDTANKLNLKQTKRASFSTIGFEKFETLRGIDISYLPREEANDLFPVNRLIPERLWVGLHELLDAPSYAYGCPQLPLREAMASARVESLLIQAIKAVKIENKLTQISNEIRLKPQHLLTELKYDPHVGPGNMDFVVVTKPEGAERSRGAVMVEVKIETAEQGLPQLLLAQEKIFETNHDQRPVYGFATNGYNWILSIYNANQKNKYRLSETMCLFEKFNEVDEWKKGQAATIVKLVYGILASELEYSKEIEKNLEDPDKKIELKLEEIEELRKNLAARELELLNLASAKRAKQSMQ